MPTEHLTKQRAAVLEVVQSSSDHPSAAEVMDRLRGQNYKFAYATVYNSLNYLVEHGYITELHVDSGVTRYDSHTELHHHAVCVRCGKVMEVFTPVPDAYLESVEHELGASLEHHQVVFRVVCDSCRPHPST